MANDSVDTLMAFYLKNYAEGKYLYHWMNKNNPKELLVMTDCGEKGMQVGGIPIPMGHWGHQLQQGPPNRAYFQMIRDEKASEMLCISKQDLEILRSRLPKSQ